MKTKIQGNPNLSWVLRFTLIFMILFFALFSLDVFDEASGFWETALGLFMHNIPSFVMIIILAVAWKWEHIGGILLMLGIAGFGLFFGLRSGNFMMGTAIMLGIPFLIGLLFVINHYFLHGIKGA